MKLLKFALVSSIGFVILIFAYLINEIYTITLEDAKKNHQMQQLEMARVVSEGVGYFLEHLIKDMELLTSSRQFHQKSKTVMSGIIEQFRANYDSTIIRTIIIIDSSKNIVLAGGKSPPAWTSKIIDDLLTRFDDPLFRGEFLLSSVLPDDSDNVNTHKSFLVILPINHPAETYYPLFKYIGYLVNFNSLMRNYIIPLNLRSNDFVWILDGQGRLIYHPRHEEMLFKSFYDMKDECLSCHKSFDDQIRMLNSDTASYGEYWVLGDEPSKIFAYVPLNLENQKWYIAISTLLPYVTDKLKDRFNLFFILGIVIFFTILAFVIIIYYLNLKRIRADEERKNIEKIQEYQEQLNHSSRLASIGELVDSVAHEINTPLGVISAQADAALLQNSSGELNREEIEIIKKQTRRISEYTKTLLNFSKRIPFNSELLNIKELLNESIFLLQPKFREKNIKIEKYFFDSVSLIHGDRRQLEQVFVNLLNNAVDSISKSGNISLNVRRKAVINAVSNNEQTKEFIEIIIADNGCGIRPEDIEKIFNPFFSTKEKNGTGLGLSISKSIIQRHKGKIEVVSELGSGSKFIIILPITQE